MRTILKITGRVPSEQQHIMVFSSPEMTSFIFRETAMIHLLLWGNSFSQIIRDGMRRVVGLYKVLKNEGQLPRYYIRDNHPAIIDRAIFDRVQEKIKANSTGEFTQENFLS